MPPATTGAGPLIDPPFARTLFTVSNSRLVSTSQRIAPSRVECAQTGPSFAGERTARGITVTAENSAPLHERLNFPHGSGSAGGATHARSPDDSSIACSP